MRPRLKNSTLYVPSADGVYIISNSGTLTLKGKQIYQWLDSIAPHLDGQRTLDEITGGLSAERRELVGNLVRALLDKGFVKDVTGELGHTLTAEELAAYASEIAFLDYYVDSPAHRFERYRTSRVLAVGSGRTLTALVQANLHAGLRQVDVAGTPEGTIDTARHHELLAHAQRRDPAQTLVAHAAWDPARFDAVIHVSDRPMRARARELNRACVAAGRPLIQAVVDGDRAWLGPLVTGPGDACWECAWLRVLGQRGDAGGFADHRDAPVSDFLAAPTAAIVANQASFEIFKHVAGGGPLETAGALLAIDLETLDSKAHPVTRHPLCEAHGDAAAPDVVEAVRRREAGPALDPEEFSRQAARLYDDATGVLGELGELDLEQLPLKVARATVSNPMASRGLGAVTAALGVATEFVQARQRATRRACELYAAAAVDPRRCVDGRVAGYDLAARAARAVRADAVFPVLAGKVADEATAPGLASGLSWAEAVGRGLLAHAARQTAAAIAEANTAFPAIELDAVPRVGNAARYARMLGIAGEALAVYDVTGALGVPTFAGCVGEATVGYAAHLDPAQAVEVLLERAVQAYQARAAGQPIVAPPPVPGLPAARRGAVGPVAPAEATAWPEICELVVRRLARAGWRPIAVPLDHDPVLERVLPYVVHVVLEAG